MRWERSRKEEESWVRWRREQSEEDEEAETRERWSLVCDVPQIALRDCWLPCGRLNYDESN